MYTWGHVSEHQTLLQKFNSLFQTNNGGGQMGNIGPTLVRWIMGLVEECAPTSTWKRKIEVISLSRVRHPAPTTNAMFVSTR